MPRRICWVALPLVATLACQPQPPTVPPGSELVIEGRRLFFEETFDGNGRTCGSCHPAENNLTLDPEFIASLPADDPLFVAERVLELEQNFENPVLMRAHALIIENLDGFDDLANVFTVRGIPHIFAPGLTIESRDGPRTGWSGDGAPGDGTLRSFAVGAVIQHFPRTLERVAGSDFRLPTGDELDALEAFQLALGRREELSLPLPLRDPQVVRGQAIFNSASEGKCLGCHFNAGANAAPQIFGADAGNLNFDTGVENLPDQPIDQLGERVPPDDGFGRPGNGEFNTPSVVESADTPPFFHNDSVETLEGAVAFYNGRAFNESPAGQLLVGATGSGIDLDATQVEAVAAFLRVINVLENIRQSIEMVQARADNRLLPWERFDQLFDRAIDEINDAEAVLADGGLHPEARRHLAEARQLCTEARSLKRPRDEALRAIEYLEAARAEMIE